MEKLANKDGKHAGLVIASVLAGILFLLFFSGSTSPLSGNFYCLDSAFFQGVGKLMNSGYVMYRDIFDEKGPFMFFIEALGYSFGGRYGVFFIQILFMSASIVMLKKCVDVARTENKIFVFITALMLFFINLSFSFDCGNLSEEYALPFLFFTLYIHIRSNRDNDIKKIYMYIMGAGFGIIAFTRVTNAVFICVCMAYYLLSCLVKKEIKKAFLQTLRFLAGFCLAIAPFMIYYALKGALYDMIFATFIFGFRYATKGSFLTRFLNLRWPETVSFALIYVFSVINCRKNIKKVLFLCISFFFNMFVLMLGYSFSHYYQIICVAIVAAWILMFEENEAGIKAGMVTCVIAGFTVFNSYGILTQSARAVSVIFLNSEKTAQSLPGKAFMKLNEKYDLDYCGYKRKERYEDLISRIPEEYHDSVYSYSGGSNWLLYSGMNPYNKYCQTADNFASMSDKVAGEIEYMFKNDPPAYVITSSEAEIKNEAVSEILENDYVIVYSNEKLVLNKSRSLSDNNSTE
ncbi:MAG: glycosyltransferase family 39 protein [Lachnospiraceae bacterium]|nr:glycosyltransferase family 39 protein [Lachnospiraceae bacterium]